MSESTASLEYKHFPWGEIIYATKAEIQRLGIGAELAFPGEPGGPKRAMKVIDPRGLPTTVDLAYDRERYCARIHFPEREKQLRFRTEYAPGVVKRSEYCWCDEYVGTAEALAAAGLVRLDHLPGQPGMRKMRVTIFSDGTIPTGAPTVRHRRSEEPGAKMIERASKTTFSVRVIIAQEDRVRRAESIERADQEYETRMRALPRPPPLVGASAQVRDVFRDKPSLTAVTRDFPPREITRGESPPKPLLTLVGDNVVPFGAVVAAKNKSNRSSGGLADIKRQLDATAWCLYEAHQNIRRALPSDQWGGLDILKFLAGCLEKESSKLSSIIEAGGNP